jgi:hypothetical protein
MGIDELEAAALKLEPKARARLAERLLKSETADSLAPTTSQAWTYHVVAIPPGDTGRAERELNQKAAGGWELIAVSGGNWYFRRGR